MNIHVTLKYISPAYSFHIPDRNCIVNGPKNRIAVKNRGAKIAGTTPDQRSPNCSYKFPLLKVSPVKKHCTKNGANNIITDTLKNLLLIVDG